MVLLVTFTVIKPVPGGDAAAAATGVANFVVAMAFAGVEAALPTRGDTGAKRVLLVAVGCSGACPPSTSAVICCLSCVNQVKFKTVPSHKAVERGRPDD